MSKQIPPQSEHTTLNSQSVLWCNIWFADWTTDVTGSRFQCAAGWEIVSLWCHKGHLELSQVEWWHTDPGVGSAHWDCQVWGFFLPPVRSCGCSNKASYLAEAANRGLNAPFSAHPPSFSGLYFMQGGCTQVSRGKQTWEIEFNKMKEERVTSAKINVFRIFWRSNFLHTQLWSCCLPVKRPAIFTGLRLFWWLNRSLAH